MRSSKSQPVPQDRDKTALLRDLRRRIRKLESPSPVAGARITLGDARLDGGLPDGGLASSALHEISGAVGPADGFAAALLARLPADTPILWCRRDEDLYGPGLSLFGLSPGRLLLVRAHKDQEVLWCLEEALQSRVVPVVLGLVERLSDVAARRLQLAAEANRAMVLLRRPSHTFGCGPGGVARTRWQVAWAPSSDAARVGEAPRWRLTLAHCRGGNPDAWGDDGGNSRTVEWCHETFHFRLAADLRQRPSEPARAPVRRVG